MLTSLIIAGFGGQGVMAIGKLVGECAFLQGLKTTYYPSYGPQQRGGTANCTVMISDREIGAPMADEADILMAMNQSSLDEYASIVKSGGLILTNSTLADSSTVNRNDVRILDIDADNLAYKIGSPKVANIIMIAVYMTVSKAMDPAKAKEIVLKKMAKKPEFIEMNEKAFDTGTKLGESA